MTDPEFICAFEDCTLPADRWTHRAHVRMAWFYLCTMPLTQAISIIRTGIQRYNAALSKPLAYHETVTVAFVHLIKHAIEQSESTSFDGFCDENPHLLDRKMTALLSHYLPQTLWSDAARASFVAPDLIPLP